MFNNKKYKSFALQQLKGRWGIPIIISAIITVVTSIFAMPDLIRSFEQLQNLEALATTTVTTSSNTSIISSLIQTIVSGIFTIAALNVYIQMTRSPEPVSFSLFIEGLNNWWRATLATLWQFLWVFLWSLLFFIPGIVKSISYSMMPYIIAEYKNVSVAKAMKISMVITKGHKMDLFVLGLSFLGWILLSVFTLGIGLIVLSPYMELTYVNTFHDLLQEAIQNGSIKLEDLDDSNNF
jgi:uncharacterized membrane protein